MGCEIINRSPEQIRNAFSNKNLLWDINKNDPIEVLMARLDFFNDNMTLPEGENQTYWIAGYNIKNRPSNLAKKAYENRYGKTGVQKEVNKPDFTKKKNLGTRVHNIVAEIMDAIYNKKGSLSDIEKRASLGDYAIKGKNFEAVVAEVKEQIKVIEKTQKSIDPSKKAFVRVEQRMASPLRDIGGALDVLAVFSDKTLGRIDYKTAHAYESGNLTDELLSINKVGDYELSMNEYGKILNEDIGFKGDRLVRLVPIRVQLKLKNKSQRKEGDNFTTEVDLVETTNSPYLKPIPIFGERTKYAGIDALLSRQWTLVAKLSKKLEDKSLNKTDRDGIKARLKKLRKSIQRTIIEEDITDIIKSVNLLSNELGSRIYESKTLEDGKENLKYLTDGELQDLIDELSLYTDIIENTHKYYSDLKINNPELFETLKDGISKASSNTLGVLSRARVHREQRLFDSMEELIGDSFRDPETGKPFPLDELGFFTRNFTRISEIPHPVFRAAWKMIQSSYYKMRRDIRSLDEELAGVEKNLFSWAKQNGMSRLDALKLLVNTDTGMLVSKLSQALIDKIQNALVNPDRVEGVKTLKSIFHIPNLDKYKESYKARLQKYKETQVHKYEEGENNLQYKKDINNWISENDLLTSDKAWFNKFNRNYWLRIKESVRDSNISEEYKRIKNNKALSDYYDLYVKYNKIFRDMLDISDYKTLPPNFIPNIRKTMVDSIAMDKLNFKAAGREFFESLQVRDEDVFIGDVDENGEVRRTIPILFLNPFKNKDGEIDNTRKSYDLSKNLLIFAKMAYNYKYMHEVEPKILQMREYMANPTSEVEGTKVTTKSGKPIVGKMSRWMTKKGFDTDTYKLFEELTDAYLYGIRFKEKGVQGGKIDGVKLLLKLKQFFGKSTLGLAVIPALGALGAGSVGSIFEGSKRISYTNKQMRQAQMNLLTQHDKYKGLSLFYDVYAEDPLNRLIDNKSVNFFSKIGTSRNLMYPLRKADELINEAISNAMALNWGIDVEGKLGKKNALIRLSDKSRDTSGIPTIWELTTLDKNTGKIEIKGLTEENYLAFRDAVKSTSEGIIGSLSQEDLSRIDTNLMFNVMFQFKSWMPGIVKERMGDLRYDSKLQATRWGRFKAATRELGLTDTDFQTGFQFKQYLSKIFLPNVAKFTLDLFTFGAGTGLGLTSNTYIDSQGKERRIRSNLERAKRMYHMYRTEHPERMGDMTFDQFLETKEAQMRAFTNELRAILMFAVIIHLLGGGGDDGEPAPYMANWFNRFMYKNFTKAQSELTFMWNPGELINLFKNPIPMAGLLTRGINTAMNGMDEVRDLMQGENSLSDNTPIGYYTLQWIYGGGQIARFIELYKQYEKSPYLMSATGR